MVITVYRRTGEAKKHTTKINTSRVDKIAIIKMRDYTSPDILINETRKTQIITQIKNYSKNKDKMCSITVA